MYSLCFGSKLISIHALREEGDTTTPLQRGVCTYFYPRPPRGGRPAQLDQRITAVEFLSTPSARRATPPANTGSKMTKISIHALREEGDNPGGFLENRCIISIHALREEGDRQLGVCPQGACYFYPRPPRGGRRLPIIAWLVSV